MDNGCLPGQGRFSMPWPPTGTVVCNDPMFGATCSSLGIIVINLLPRERDWIGRWTGTTTRPLWQPFWNAEQVSAWAIGKTGGTHVKKESKSITLPTSQREAQLPASANHFPV